MPVFADAATAAVLINDCNVYKKKKQFRLKKSSKFVDFLCSSVFFSSHDCSLFIFHKKIILSITKKKIGILLLMLS